MSDPNVSLPPPLQECPSLGALSPILPWSEDSLGCLENILVPGHSPDLSGAGKLIVVTRTSGDAYDQCDTWWQRKGHIYCSRVFVETGLTSRPLPKQLLFLQAKFPFHAQLTASPTPTLLTFLQD